MAYSIFAQQLVQSGARLSRGFKISAEFKLDKTKEELEGMLRGLDQAVFEVMEKYAQQTKKKMVDRFEQTAVYKRPSRRTGQLLRAINQHSVSRSGKEVIARVGNQTMLPYYWKWQEGGTRGFDFTQKFNLVYRDGKPKFYSVRPARPGSLNTIKANPGSTPATNKYWQNNPDAEPVRVHLYVYNPGIRKRDFIRTGRVFLFRSLPNIYREILERAAPTGGKSGPSAGTFVGDF